MPSTKRSLVLLGILLFIFALLAIYAPLRSQDYTITLPTATKPAKPITIALLSDLHSGRFYQDEIIRALQEREVDLIALSGDMIDDEEDMQGAWEFFAQLDSRAESKKADSNKLAKIPKFYVSGNHEFWSGEIVAIKQKLASYNVSVLDFSQPCTTLSINGLEIAVFGVDDPYYSTYSKPDQHIDKAVWDRAKWKGGFWEQEWQELVASTITANRACQTLESTFEKVDSREANNPKADFSILLSHRPEFIELFRSLPIDLILSGHTHGGQVRIPYLLNGLYAPNQGLFPKYAGGLYELDSSKRQYLVISRGLSLNYRLPRIFNPPEVVFITLK